MGSVINTDRGTDKDISVTTDKNRYAFRVLQPVWFMSSWIWPFSPSGRYKSNCSELFIFPYDYLRVPNTKCLLTFHTRTATNICL